MWSFENIRFNNDYLRVTKHSLLLYDRYLGVSIFIHIPNAPVFPHINPFHGIPECEQHINTYIRNAITLFVSHEQLQKWNNSDNNSHEDLLTVYIFCNTHVDYLFMKQWTGLFYRRIAKVFLVEDLDFHLLQNGVELARSAAHEHDNNHDLRESFKEHGRTMCDALAKYFGRRAEETVNYGVQPTET